ncbi:MAG: hypothetical protein HUU38_09930, partial [Anaerolineales bacterium]|nr:hypothetical protein [Anaerolineales bacterium]
MENPSSEMLTFYLSQEELFTSLAYLRLPGILGLDGSVFDQLTPEQTRLSIGIAERALIARCFLTVQPNEQQLQPAPILLAALLTCARPQHTLIVTRHRPDQTFNYFFHTVNENTIFHTQNFPGVHQFIRLTPQQIAANL